MASENATISYRSGYVAADFLAHNYRVSGEIYVRSKPLADALNDATTSTLQVRNVYISPIQSPADIKGHYLEGTLRKDTISMAILAREEDGLSSSSSYGSYVGHMLTPVFLTVPGFEIRGLLEMDAKTDVKTYLITHADRFIPLSEGVATVSSNPEITFAGGMILVNKQSIGIFCIEKEEEE